MGAYGVYGWIKATPYTVSPAALLGYEAWWLARSTQEPRWQRLDVVASRQHADSLLAKLAGIDNREGAALWRGALIGVPRTLLPPRGENEFYWADLVGLAVVNRSGETLGRVVGLIDTGAHGVLRVTDADRLERLIPLVAAYIDAIEPERDRIIVDWQTDY